MRRISIAAVVVLTVVVAVLLVNHGEEARQPSELDRTLAYVPKGSTMVSVIDTKISATERLSLLRLLRRPLTGLLTASPRASTRDRDGSVLTDDLSSWLGRYVVVSAYGADDLAEGRTTVVVEVRDPNALKKSVARLVTSGRLVKTAGSSGSPLYTSRDRDTVIAVTGQFVLVAGSRAKIESAFATRRGEASFQTHTINTATRGLPTGPARVFVDVHALIAARDDHAALFKIPWVRSLSTLGAVARPDPRGLRIGFKLKSTRRDLNPEDVPIATGSRTPQLYATSGGYLRGGLRDLAHTVRFAEDAASALSPGLSGVYQQAKSGLRDGFGIDIDQDLIEELGGDSALVFGRRGIAARVELKKPALVRRNVGVASRVAATALKALDLEDLQLKAGPGANYRLVRRGRTLFSYGVSREQFALGIGGIDPLSVQTGVPSRTTGAGALIFSGRPKQLIPRLDFLYLPELISGYLRSFQTVRGSVTASREKLNGTVLFKDG